MTDPTCRRQTLRRVEVQPGYVVLLALAFVVVALIWLQSKRDAAQIQPKATATVAESASPATASASHQQTSSPIAAAPPPESTDGKLMGRASVIDGDTIEIHGTRIRFNGIDAPESNQNCEANGVSYRCGQKASLALSDFIGAHTVSCIKTGMDRYRRVIAKCFTEGTDLSGWMVSNGWAIAYRKYSTDYVADEERAKEAKQGIWAGSFIAPEDFRRGKQREK